VADGLDFWGSVSFVKQLEGEIGEQSGIISTASVKQDKIIK
jgi:hypothetical protein